MVSQIFVHGNSVTNSFTFFSCRLNTLTTVMKWFKTVEKLVQMFMMVWRQTSGKLAPDRRQWHQISAVPARDQHETGARQALWAPNRRSDSFYSPDVDMKISESLN